MHVLRFGNKLNEEVCRGIIVIFANLVNSLYLLVRLWWKILVANLATNFQDLVAKVKNVVELAPVLGAISRPATRSSLSWFVMERFLYLQSFRLVVVVWNSFTSSLRTEPEHPAGQIVTNQAILEFLKL